MPINAIYDFAAIVAIKSITQYNLDIIDKVLTA
jgi:hypothetical protein